MVIINKHDSLFSWRVSIILLIVYSLANGLIIKSAYGANVKFTHGPLASPLNSRSKDFGTQGNSVSTNSGNLKTSNGSGGTSPYQPSAVTGGEVIVPKSFPLSSQEPTCEQLRAMWIFSKRQSRAAEITNEIPTFRDPFAYNVWEPYYSSTRSMGAVRMLPRFGDRTRSPVFGRVISREPLLPQRISFGQRQRIVNPESGSSRIYAAENKQNGAGSRRPAQNRYIGGSNGSTSISNSMSNSNSVAVQGSFQKLKELIWTERAKELTQQRRAEELAARAAVLKEIANGQNLQPSYKQYNYKSDSPLMDENRSPDSESHPYLNDGHANIISAQTQNNLNSKTNNGKTATRSFGGSNQAKALYKSSVFSGNPSSNSGRAGRLFLPRTLASSYSLDDSAESDSRKGISRAYPMRQSHFRERNRAMFKQTIPTEHFERENRGNIGNDAKTTFLENVLQNLNQQLQQKYENILAENAAYEQTDTNDDLIDEDTYPKQKFVQNLIFGKDKDYNNYYDD